MSHKLLNKVAPRISYRPRKLKIMGTWGHDCLTVLSTFGVTYISQRTLLLYYTECKTFARVREEKVGTRSQCLRPEQLLYTSSNDTLQTSHIFLCYGTIYWSPEKVFEGIPQHWPLQSDLWKGQSMVGMGARVVRELFKGLCFFVYNLDFFNWLWSAQGTCGVADVCWKEYLRVEHYFSWVVSS